MKYSTEAAQPLDDSPDFRIRDVVALARFVRLNGGAFVDGEHPRYIDAAGTLADRGTVRIHTSTRSATILLLPTRRRKAAAQ